MFPLKITLEINLVIKIDKVYHMSNHVGVIFKIRSGTTLNFARPNRRKTNFSYCCGDYNRFLLEQSKCSFRPMVCLVTEIICESVTRRTVHWSSLAPMIKPPTSNILENFKKSELNKVYN